ncbi:gamma-glutamyltransferase [Lonsdalea quercina]|uniref:gamma-glutamyltransferase n=1 Tax=Lonsdalea quercina TaxID=71657 RepID=UPI0039748B6D
MISHACGKKICLASPHYKSAISGISGFIHCENSLQECAIMMAISLFHNLPHLCGLGGDAIIMEKVDGDIQVINGTGKTGTFQNELEYESKGLFKIPRRGVHSTMVYGAPYAFDSFIKKRNIDIQRVINEVVKNDYRFGFINLPEFKRIFDRAKLEITDQTNLDEWDNVIYGGNPINMSLIQTMVRISKCGFSDLYRGLLAEKTFDQVNKFDNKLYVEEDFTNFTPNKSEVRSIKFLDSIIYCHGENSPWKQLFLMLRIYEFLALKNIFLDDEEICVLAAYVEEEAIKLNEDMTIFSDEVNIKASLLIDGIKNKNLKKKDLFNKQSHTIFLAGVNDKGDLVGITNSIFTPLGALFEIPETGILMSNRCYAFNETKKYQKFQEKKPVNHTNNCVIVESPSYSFIIGTSGGPVQSQTLSFLINKIVIEGYEPHEAIVLPRFANMGVNPKTNEVMYITEKKEYVGNFVSTNGFSNKLGIVQIAGVDKRNNLLFACADPRGPGVALGY